MQCLIPLAHRQIWQASCIVTKNFTAAGMKLERRQPLKTSKPAGPNSDWFAHLNMRWNDAAAITSATVDTSDLTPAEAQAVKDVLVNDAFATFDGKVGLRDHSESWNLSLVVNNILDEKYNVLAFAVPSQPGQFDVFSAPPRSVAVEFSMTF